MHVSPRVEPTQKLMYCFIASAFYHTNANLSLSSLNDIAEENILDLTMTFVEVALSNTKLEAEN